MNTTQKTPISQTAETITRLLAELENPDFGDDTELLGAVYQDMSRLIPILHRIGGSIVKHSDNVMKAAREANRVALNAAFQRVLHGIPGEIRDIRRAIDAAQDRYDAKYKALKSEGLTDTEIAAIIAPPTDQERQEAEAKIAALEAESRKLSDFQKSGPKFAYELLRDTALEYLIAGDDTQPEHGNIDKIQDAA